MSHHHPSSLEEVYGGSAAVMMNEIKCQDVYDLAANELWPSLDYIFPEGHDFTLNDCIEQAQRIETELLNKYGIPIHHGHKALWLVARSIKSGMTVEQEYAQWKQSNK